MKKGGIKEMRRVAYNRGDEILEVVIRDQTGSKIEVRRCNIADEKECGRMFKWLKDKYGLKMKLDGNLIDIDSEFFKF